MLCTPPTVRVEFLIDIDQVWYTELLIRSRKLIKIHPKISCIKPEIGMKKHVENNFIHLTRASLPLAPGFSFLVCVYSEH